MANWFSGWFGETQGSGGGLTPEEHAKLMSLGDAPITRVSPVGAGGQLTLRRGFAYKDSRGDAPSWTVARDLSGSTSIELRIVGGATISTAGQKEAVEGGWRVWFDLDDAQTATLPRVSGFTYIVVPVFPNSPTPDPVEGLSGLLTVL